MHHSRIYHSSTSLYVCGLSSILLSVLVQTSALEMNEDGMLCVVGRVGRMVPYHVQMMVELQSTKRIDVSPADPTSLHVAGSREGRGRSQM